MFIGGKMCFPSQRTWKLIYRRYLHSETSDPKTICIMLLVSKELTQLPYKVATWQTIGDSITSEGRWRRPIHSKLFCSEKSATEYYETLIEVNKKAGWKP